MTNDVARLDAQAHLAYRQACNLARVQDPAATAAFAAAHAAARAASVAHDRAANDKEADAA